MELFNIKLELFLLLILKEKGANPRQKSPHGGSGEQHLCSPVFSPWL